MIYQHYFILFLLFFFRICGLCFSFYLLYNKYNRINIGKKSCFNALVKNRFQNKPPPKGVQLRMGKPKRVQIQHSIKQFFMISENPEYSTQTRHKLRDVVTNYVFVHSDHFIGNSDVAVAYVCFCRALSKSSLCTDRLKIHTKTFDAQCSVFLIE